MTKTFERFLRSFSDEELRVFAQERARVRPPYWQAMQLALPIEADRRSLRLEEEPLRLPAMGPTPDEARTGTA